LRFEELSETLDLIALTLGSPSDSEPNPFLETTTDLSGPIIPGWFRLTVPPVISEEAFVRAVLEPSPFRIHDSFLTPLTISETLTPAATQSPISLEKPDNMPSRTNIPTPLSLSAPKWDGQSKMLRNFLRIVEQLFRVTEITDDRQKLDWLTSYADADIANLWSSFSEYEAGSWTLFLERLKIEYPELMSEEQGTMEQLRKLCREYQEISMLEEERLMSFKKRFMFMVQKCLKPPAVTGNRELVELFIKSLDTTFQDALNSRLSLQGTLKVDGQGRGQVEDPYTLDHVVQKAVDLVSGKTIARALKHTPVILSRNRKVDAESRGPVTFSKEEMVWKVEQGPDIESLQQEINVLKTMYEQQERGREKHEKYVQGAIDSIRTLLQNQGPVVRETVAPPLRYGPSQPPILPRPPRKCFYCFEPDHLFLFCPAKTEDERKELILVDKFTVRFANGESIPTEYNMSIKDCVRKYLPSLIAVMMWGDPELETCSVWD